MKTNQEPRCLCVCHSDKPYLSPHKEDRCFCNNQIKKIESWEKEFEEKFTKVRPDGYRELTNLHTPDIKEFIRKVREQAIRDTAKRIEKQLYTENGFLREDDCVTSDVLRVIIDICKEVSEWKK